ncbi:7TM-DISM domain-containing protein [Deinococcus malanensis]|uniref:7TM-DISM domain-containing protein n=1 Tax=Deinococcus malanensis TaxID=1706855 RepID=UPI003627FC46
MGRVLAALAVFVLVFGLLWSPASAQLPRAGSGPPALEAQFQLLEARDRQFPRTVRDIPAWQDRQTPVQKVRFTGGRYWLVAEVRNPSADTAWVFNPHGSLIEQVNVRVYRPGQAVQTFRTGYRAEHPYMLHYGVDLTLRPGERTWVVAQIRSPYFASQPDFSFVPQDRYRQQVNLDNLLTLGAFGRCWR